MKSLLILLLSLTFTSQIAGQPKFYREGYNVMFDCGSDRNTHVPLPLCGEARVKEILKYYLDTSSVRQMERCMIYFQISITKEGKADVIYIKKYDNIDLENAIGDLACNLVPDIGDWIPLRTKTNESIASKVGFTIDYKNNQYKIDIELVTGYRDYCQASKIIKCDLAAKRR